VVVKKDGEVFLVIKRKVWLGVKCRFFKNDNLVLESYLFPFFLPFVTIKYQNLPKEVSLHRKLRFFYSLLYDDIEFSLKLKLFRNPDYFFFKDGIQRGSLTNLKQTLGHNVLYKLETDIDDEEINLLFVILLYIHLRYF
jgi:hypothetical protein